MPQLLFVAKIYQIKDTKAVPLGDPVGDPVGDPIELYSVQELQSLIIKTFPGEKTYMTKECGTKESLIKSTTNVLTLIHLTEVTEQDLL